jgi:alpha-1,6-mannosyltransferase
LARLGVATATGVLIAACVGLATVPNLAEAPRALLALFGLAFIAYAAGLLALRALADSRAFVIALVVGAICRLVLLPAPPTLSTDAYRYVWDARVAAAGINPYAHPPVAPEVAQLRDLAIYPRLNHPTWLTIYPPAAQLFFRAVYAVAPDSVLAIKVALGAAEIVGLALLVALLRALCLPRARVAIYAWNPLVLVEVWGSGHLDALAVAAVIAAVLAVVTHRHGLAAVMLGLATLVKLYPAALLPLLVRSGGLRVLGPFTIVVALGYASFVGTGMQALGSLPRYLSEEYFNPGLVRSIVAAPAAPLLAMAAWVAWVAWRRPSASLVDRVVPTIGGFVVLSPNVFPWYALWLVPFLAVAPSLWWIAFTGTVALAYTFFLYQPWAIPMWARLLEIAPLVVGVSWWLGTKLRHGSATGNSQPRDTRATPGGTIAEAPGDASQAGR